LTFANTHSNGDPECDNLATDVSGYKSKDLPSNPGKTDFAKMDIFAEFKFDANADPFIDPEGPTPNKEFERDTDTARLLRGQLSSYVAALSGSQFRVHVFTILIFGRLARLMFWDRNGTVVSRAFDYTRFNYIGLFLQKYDQNIDRRGHDPSVTISSQKQFSNYDLSELKKDNNRHREFRIMLIPDRDDASKNSRFFISYPPKYTSRSPFGRATRPMLAFDVDESRVVFVKDYWRSVGTDKEGDIYRILVEHKVPHIATFEKGNDVVGNVTIVEQLRTASWACPTTDMAALQNYRMSLKEVGRRLSRFKSSFEFVCSIAHAMEGKEAHPMTTF